MDSTAENFIPRQIYESKLIENFKCIMWPLILMKSKLILKTGFFFFVKTDKKLNLQSA